MARSFWAPVADAAFFPAGERLCNLEEGSPGSGTYTRHGYIFSSLAGCMTKSSENGAVKGAAFHLLGLCLAPRLPFISRSLGKGTVDAPLAPHQEEWVSEVSSCCQALSWHKGASCFGDPWLCC